MDSFKVLGQSNPGAASDVDIYTVPTGTQAVARVRAFNYDVGASTIQIRVRVAGAANNNKQFVEKDFSLAANTSYISPVITLGATDVIRVQASTTNVAFNVFGLEIT